MQTLVERGCGLDVHQATVVACLLIVSPNGNVRNFFNASWQKAYWGVHYPKLRAVKRKYDPDGLFFVHQGVGSEEWSADGFTRV